MSKNVNKKGLITNNTNGANASSVISTQVPGVDMTQVIASPPHLVKENSAKVETRVIVEVRRK